MEIPILTVSAFVQIVNQILDTAFGEVIVEGEISGFRVSKNKYVYFDLKDEESTVNCFMTIYQLKTPLQDGMQVRVYGSARLTPWGRFSLTARAVEPAGEGALKKAFELLQAKLTAEGLFDPARKRSLPLYPQTIGLITSAGSAAAADFIKIAGERWGGVDMQLCDVLVQGVDAPEQIIQAIEHFNLLPEMPDALVIIRGGGSIDDLAAFSTEPVVRAVAGSRVPTLIAIGHETDLSLAELAADLRASTPSNAAELLLPDKTTVLHQLGSIKQQLNDTLGSAVDLKRESLGRITQELGHGLATIVQTFQHELALKSSLLEALNPAAVLSRGYAVVTRAGRAAGSVSKLKKSDKVGILFRDGRAEAQITDVRID